MELVLALLTIPLVPFLVAALLPRGWLTLVAIPVMMLAAFLLATFGVPEHGSSDPAGHGMSVGYYWLMVFAGLLGAGMGWMAQVARQIWPALLGWRYALVMAALFMAGLATGFGLIA